MAIKHKYRICIETWNDDGCCCPCYGLKCGAFVIRFISTDRRFVELLAVFLNRLEADPERALDIIELMLP